MKSVYLKALLCMEYSVCLRCGRVIACVTAERYASAPLWGAVGDYVADAKCPHPRPDGPKAPGSNVPWHEPDPERRMKIWDDEDLPVPPPVGWGRVG